MPDQTYHAIVTGPDELTQIIETHYRDEHGLPALGNFRECADAIIAAGWLPPDRDTPPLPGGPVLDRAIEVAARAWCDRDQATRRGPDRHRPDGKLWQWEDHRPEDQRAYRALVEPIVGAIAACGLLAQDDIENGDPDA